MERPKHTLEKATMGFLVTNRRKGRTDGKRAYSHPQTEAQSRRNLGTFSFLSWCVNGLHRLRINVRLKRLLHEISKLLPTFFIPERVTGEI